jgi:putative ABC transport system substrate-binding protein
MRRREFITLLGGSVATWPLVARAEQPERMRSVGLLIATTADDAEYQGRMQVFRQRLEQLGWTDGRNVRLDFRWASTSPDELRRHAAELLAQASDVIVATTGTTTLAPLLERTRTVPIVFVLVIDPVGSGFVASLARPGGNATGFVMFEYSLANKWPELIKQIAPPVSRVAVLRDAGIASGIGQFSAIQSAAPSLGLETTPLNVRDAAEIERDIASFANGANGGLIVTSSPRTLQYRDLIIGLAARHRLPAVYATRHFAVAGGLMAYGPDTLVQFRQAADYTDRILRGEKPADLPVQAPTKYELVINLKTAKALGIEIPTALLARADAVIE